MISDLSWMPFKNISLDDPFFESLKDDYPGFDVWFKKKSLNGDKALVLLEEERIHAFLALKDENEEIVLTGNILPAIARLKISTSAAAEFPAYCYNIHSFSFLSPCRRSRFDKNRISAPAFSIGSFTRPPLYIKIY